MKSQVGMRRLHPGPVRFAWLMFPSEHACAVLMQEWLEKYWDIFVYVEGCIYQLDEANEDLTQSQLHSGLLPSSTAEGSLSFKALAEGQLHVLHLVSAVMQRIASCRLHKFLLQL